MVSTAGGIVIAVIVLALAAAVGWVVFVQMRARKLGLSPPTLSSYLPWHRSDNQFGPPRPAPGGVVGWFNGQVRKFKNRNNRSAAGAYEEPLQGGGGGGGGRRRGFGPLDPDEAWDARVDAEPDTYGYYEETELGAGRPSGARGGGGGGSYSMNLPNPYGPDDNDDDDGDHHADDGGRGRRGAGRPGDRNPFDDDAEASLRGVSPRPMDGAQGGRQARDSGSGASSPTERRSAFREVV